MTLYAGMKAIGVVDMVAEKLDIKDIGIIGVGKFAVESILEHQIPDDGIVDIADLGVKLFSSDAVGTIARIDVVWIEMGSPSGAVV